MNRDRVLIISGWLLVIVATLLLFFNIPLTSDSLYLEDAARNLLLHNGLWDQWRFTLSPNYVPDMFLYFAAFKIFAYPAERTLFVTLAEALLVCVAALFLAKKIKPDLTAIAKTALLVLVALTSLTSLYCNMWLYFNTTNNHVGPFIFSLLALGCLISYLRDKNKSAVVSLIAISVTAIVCDELFVIGFYATAIILLSFFLGSIFLVEKYRQYHIYKTPLLVSLSALLVSYPIASIISLFVTFNNPANGRLMYSWNGILYSLQCFIAATKNIFYPFNVAAWLYSLLVIVTLVGCFLLFIRLFKTHTEVEKYNIQIKVIFSAKELNAFVFCLFFLMLLIPINIAGAILSGGFIDIYAYRYFMFPIALAFILFVVYLDSQIEERRRRLFTIVLYIVVISLLAVSFFILKQKLQDNGWQTIQHIQQSGSDTIYNEAAVADCIKAIDKNHKLTAGIANYWYARSVSLRLPDNVPITAVNAYLIPHFWMSALSSIYLKPSEKYNFVIAQTKCIAPHPNSCLPLTDLISVPTGYKQFSCRNTPATILVYPNDELNNFLRPKFSGILFQGGYISTLKLSAVNLKSETGVITNNSRDAYAKTTKPGFLVRSGPLNLTPGYYQIKLYYHITNAIPGATVGALEVGDWDAVGYHMPLLNSVLPVNETVVSHTLYIMKRQNNIQEIRVWYSGHGDLSVLEITLEKIKKSE